MQYCLQIEFVFKLYRKTSIVLFSAVISEDPVHIFLMGHKCAFCVECTLAVFNTTEKCHLPRDAEQRPVFLALVSKKTAFVQETKATVAILTEMSGFSGIFFSSEIKCRTVASCQVLKRTHIVSA